MSYENMKNEQNYLKIIHTKCMKKFKQLFSPIKGITRNK